MTGAPFHIWDAADPQDRDRWISHWNSWPRREVQAHPRYAGLFVDASTRALAGAWTSDDGCVLYPFLLRSLAEEAYRVPGGPSLSDVATPYGYGGPYFWGSGTPQVLARAFWTAFSDWAAGQRLVSEFIRFALFREELLDYPGDIEEKQQNIVRDLGISDALLWMDYDHKVRKNVLKARRSGVRVEFDAGGDRLDEFLRVYHGTLDRRGAHDAYRFPRRFFEDLAAGLPGQFAYVHAVHGGAIVSTELVLVSAETVYSFLGGTDDAAYDLRPNDLLKHEIIGWARSGGKKRYVLGGGYEPGDGIFRYKRSFAPAGSVPFRVGRRILDSEAYASLVNRKRELAANDGRSWTPRPGYFPEYRA